jgi:hypothetical protein
MKYELTTLTWFCLACQGDNRRTSSRQLRRNGQLCRPTTANLPESKRQGRQSPKSRPFQIVEDDTHAVLEELEAAFKMASSSSDGGKVFLN